MSPHQYLRLKQSRKVDKFDDQKTSTEIEQAEVTAITHEDLQEYVLSQIRKITGEGNWSDHVSVWAAGAQIAHSQRGIFFAKAASGCCFITVAKVSVNGSQAIEGRWRMSVGATGSAIERSLTITKCQ